MPDAKSRIVEYRREHGFNSTAAARDRDDYAVFQGCLKAAEKGDVSAQHDVAVLYAAGEGVAQDFGEALSWWRKAAAHGNVAARYHIGNLYAQGWGVPLNVREAVNHWRQAAEQGHSGAQYNLGLLYIEGNSMPRDAAQACVLLERAVAGYQHMVNSGADVRKCVFR